MPTFKMPQFGDDVIEKRGGEFAPYTGDLPPKNTRLQVKAKQLKIKTNRNGEPMLTCVAEVNEPEGTPKAQYNGLGMWWNGNVTENGSGWVNEFLVALATPAEKNAAEVVKAFWKRGPRVADAKMPIGGTAVEAIGDLKIDPNGMPATVITKLENNNQGEQEAKVAFWIVPRFPGDTTKKSVTADSEDDVEIEEEDGVEVEQEPDDADEADDADESDEVEDEYSKEPPF